MSGTPVMIDTPKRRRTMKGCVYEAKFYYEGTDPETVMPAIGSTAAWAPSGLVPARVKDTYSDPLGCSAHLIYVTADSSDEDGDVPTTQSKENLAKTIIKRMTVKDIHLEPKWWGLRVAGKEDIGTTAFKKISIEAKKKDYEYYFVYNRCDSYLANEGDFVYRNAIPSIKVKTIDKSATPPTETITYQKYEDKDSDKGTVDLTLSPYTGLTANNVAYAGFPCKTFVYQVTYYLLRKFNTVRMFAGVNGAFPKDYAPYITTQYAWRAIDQQVETVKDTDGDVWCKITRSMELAPGGALWDHTKSVHGVWTW